MADKKRLFVVGDSFSISAGAGDSSPVWTEVVHRQLEQHHGESIEYVNCSLMGSSQEWAWKFLQIWLDGHMTDQDYLMVCLTHPSRMWFFEDLPALTNANIIDIDDHVSSERSRAIEYYIRYIQRPELDLQTVNNRMAYVCYQVLKQQLKKPLFIRCFKQELDQAKAWPEINLADGSLMEDIQHWEFEDVDADTNATFWYGLDCRYNHMCLSNHEILGKRAAHSLITGEPLDIKTGYHRALIKDDALSDADFCSKELCVKTVKHNLEHRTKYAPVLPWIKRKGLIKK